MREIKFRAWSNKLKEILDSDELLAIQDIVVREGVDKSMFITIPSKSSNYSVMQYTGLKDKNGVEIYEGDILRGRKNNHYYVKFENASFVCYHTNKEYGRWGPLSRLFDVDMKDLLDCIEVIGNIYENPELLETI